jgi:hypothetical protein
MFLGLTTWKTILYEKITKNYFDSLGYVNYLKIE